MALLGDIDVFLIGEGVRDACFLKETACGKVKGEAPRGVVAGTGFIFGDMVRNGDEGA